MADEHHREYTPSEFGRMLGVGDSALRKMARQYNEVFEKIPIEPKSGSHRYNSQHVERFLTARKAKVQGRARSFLEALKKIRAGEIEEDYYVRLADSVDTWHKLQEAVLDLQVQNLELKNEIRRLSDRLEMVETLPNGRRWE